MKITKFKVVLAALIVLISMLPTVVFASSYTSTLYLTADRRGDTRSYDGTDMHISMSCFTDTPPYSAYPQTFSISLYRKNFFGDSFIGSVTVPRDGAISESWTNVGSGNYFFAFSKAHDNFYVESDNVSMHN